MHALSRRRLLAATTGTTASLVMPAPFIRHASAAARDTLVFASAEPVTGSWDPTSHTSLGQINFEGFVFGQLFRTPLHPKDPTEIVWELATGQTLIDPYTLEYKLRDGVTFHNGAAFSSEDVKATMEYATDPGRPASALYPGPCEVEVVDRLTARLHTKEFGYPASAFQFTGGFMAILSRDDVRSPATLAQHLNGTGPFRFVEQNGNTSHLAAFDNYFKGRPRLAQVQLTYVADATTRVLGLQSGSIDVLQRLEPEQYDTLAKDARVTTAHTLSTENKYLHFRCNKPPFDNPMVRLAACHAIDRSQILELMGAAGSASGSYISPLKFGYEKVPNYPEFDAGVCQDLLAKAGFSKAQGLPEIEYITSNGFYPKTKEYGELITSMMQDQGFNVKLTVMETAAWGDRLYQRAEGAGRQHDRLRLVDRHAGAGHGTAGDVLLQGRPVRRHHQRHRRPEHRQGAGSRTFRGGHGGAQDAGGQGQRGDRVQGAVAVAVHLGQPQCRQKGLRGALHLPERANGRVQGRVQRRLNRVRW